MDSCCLNASRPGTTYFDPASLGVILVESKVIAFAALRNGHVLFANPAFAMLFGRGEMQPGLALRDLFVPDDRARLTDGLNFEEEASKVFAGRALRGDGTSFDTELHLACEAIEGQLTVVAYAVDVTGRSRSEAQLTCLAFSDPLTGLPNRSLLADRLGQEMRATRRDGQTFGVLMVDLDGFKAVNDTWGHGAGDAVLLVLAQRFVASMRASDTLARLGGDEFGVLLPRLRNPVDAEIVAARLLLDARRPIEVAGHEIRIGASVGIALYPDHGGTADAVVAAADGALYRAKREGRGRYVWAMTGCQPESSSLPLIVWSAAHEVGIEVIDSQHAYLAAAINDLADALRNGHLGEDTLGKLAEVIRLAEFHFATEERLMAQHGFEGSASHRRAHDRLLTDLRAMAVDRDFRSVTLVTRYLQGWLLRHVDGMDAELSQSLRDRGVR